MPQRPFKYSKISLTIGLLVLCVFVITQCIQPAGDAKTANELPDDLAGAAACASCHKDIYAQHLQSAHFRTSAPANEQTVMGSFNADSNRFAFSPRSLLVMQKRNETLYQAEYEDGIEKTTRRFDIVVGSGTKGQSFLNWRANKLWQLPITYFTAANTWSNSPGFPDHAVFNRVITSRCLECHTSFAAVTSPEGKEPEEFKGHKIIYGIDCERCHGAGAAHVAFQSANPTDTIARHIVNPARLSRQQSLDLCALCHGGRLQKTTPSFSFKAGDRLSDHFTVDTALPDPSKIDVHGNQYGLLRASPCFRLSGTMTCNTCHDPHAREKGEKRIYSQRCLNCHSSSTGKVCRLTKQLGTSITQNCIDCHMPVQPSRAIAVRLQGAAQPAAAMIRSHFISIYLEETKKLLPQFQK